MKILIGAVVVIIVAVGAYFLFMKPPAVEAPADDVTQEEVSNETGASVDQDGEGMVREFIVEGGMFYFTPEELEVNVGDTVRIVYKNLEGRHDLVIDEFGVRTQVLNGVAEETIEFVADRSGTFEYYCSIGNHRAQGMVGTLVVN